jgi:hypothetical protein
LTVQGFVAVPVSWASLGEPHPRSHVEALEVLATKRDMTVSVHMARGAAEAASLASARIALMMVASRARMLKMQQAAAL